MPSDPARDVSGRVQASSIPPKFSLAMPAPTRRAGRLRPATAGFGGGPFKDSLTQRCDVRSAATAVIA